MSMVEVEPGVHVFVRDLGEGDPIVLVAGFGQTHEAWDRQVGTLAEAGRRVIAYDQRGHGRSDKPLRGYDVDRLAADLVAVLDAAEVDQADLVGWSFGGQVAFRVAATRSERVSRLVLVGSNAVRASRSEAFPFGLPPEQMIPNLIAVELENRFAARRAAIQAGFGTEPRPGVLEWMTTQSLMMPSWATIECYRSMLETDLVDDIDNVRLPVVQVIGEDDPVHSARGARWLVERLPDSRLVTLPDCGHYPMFEAAEAFDAALLAALG